MKLAKETRTGELFALKIFFTDDFNEMAEAEIEALQGLDHANIVRIHEYGQGVLARPSRKPKLVNYIALEFVTHGELFDLVCLGGRLTEPEARFVFKQLVEAINYMH